MRVGIAVDLYHNIKEFSYGVNSGIGGTQYTTLILAILLRSKYDVTIFCDQEFNLDGINVEKRSQIKKLSPEDVIIFPTSAYRSDISETRARIIPWSHNNNDKVLDIVSEIAYSIVILSDIHYDLLRWHPASSKMTVIPNPFTPSLYDYSDEFEDYVVYMGALVPGKGFHYYAKFSDQFLRGRNTKLYVIGGSRIYGQQRESMGELGVTSESYERTFLPYVEKLVEAGQIVFTGVLGPECFTLARKAKLGLVNPTGRTEVFPMVNLELMSLGVPSIGGYHLGNVETLYPDERLHIHRPAQIPDKINWLLDNPHFLKEMRPKARKYAETKVDMNRMMGLWSQLIEGVGKKESHPLSRPYSIDCKIPIYVLSKLGLRMKFDNSLGRLILRLHSFLSY
jgi:glycosyltransferase involved in cell wall biosynthesis